MSIPLDNMDTKPRIQVIRVTVHRCSHSATSALRGGLGDQSGTKKTAAATGREKQVATSLPAFIKEQE